MFVPTDNDNGHPMSIVCEVTSKSTQVSRWYRDALSFSETGLPNGPDESDCIISVLWTVCCITKKHQSHQSLNWLNSKIRELPQLILVIRLPVRRIFCRNQWVRPCEVGCRHRPSQSITTRHEPSGERRICGFVDPRIGKPIGESSRKNHGVFAAFSTTFFTSKMEGLWRPVLVRSQNGLLVTSHPREIQKVCHERCWTEIQAGFQLFISGLNQNSKSGECMSIGGYLFLAILNRGICGCCRKM